MQTVMERIPQMAMETRQKFSRAFGSGTTSISQNKQNSNRLAELINSKYNDDLIEAMRILHQFYLQNKDLSVYVSRVINLLPRDNIELKRLCQSLLSEFASQPNARNSKSQGDVLLLAISPIYKDLFNFSTCVKLSALKTLPTLRIPECIPLLMTSIKQIVADKNPMVRKVAALTILKLHDLNKEEITEDEYSDGFNFLFKDTPSVRVAVLHTLAQIGNDQKLTYMHKRYFTLVKDLQSLNHLELERAIHHLHQYSLLYFDKHSQDKDLIKLLDACETLLKYPYPGVVVAISALFLDYPQENRLKRLIKTLVRFLNISSESKFIVLQVLHTISLRYPQLLKDYYRSFTIIQIERLYCKLLKLEILHHLIDEHNFNQILEELLYQAKCNQPQLVAVAVKLLSRTTIKFPKFIKRTIKSLMDILKSGTSETKNHVIASFCNIMTTQESMLPLLAICLQNLDDISDIRYKAAVIRLLRQQVQLIPTIASENLRKLTLKFTQQHENVKYEILLLSYELSKHVLSKDKENHEHLVQLHQYLNTLSQFDQSLLVRDLHRMLSNNIDIPVGFPIEKALSQQTFENALYPIGSLSHLIGYEMPGIKHCQFVNEDTTDLRKIVQEVVIQQPVQQQPQQPQQAIVTIPVPEKPIDKNQERKKQNKQIEEDVKKQYQNLDQVLDDFFTQQD